MTIKELKEILEQYSDNAEVIVTVSDNVNEFWEYRKSMYDTWVEGDADKK